jgi:hypothetical protein
MQCFSLFGELKVTHEKDSSKPKSEQEIKKRIFNIMINRA